MKKAIYLIISILVLSTNACKNNGKFLPSITGGAFEVLVVVDNNTWKSSAGRKLFDLLNQSMPCMPQPEPYFSISRTTPEGFTSLLKPTRNIIQVEISEKYTQTKIQFIKDKWAAPQSLIKIVTPNDSAFINLIQEKGEEIIDYFVVAERERQLTYLKGFSNNEAISRVEKKFGISINIPTNINKYKEDKNVLWMSTGSGKVRQDIVIYTYPYTDKNTFTPEYLLRKRDSVLKVTIPGPAKNSYMTTEYKIPPIFKEVWAENRYCAEIRGLWKVEGDFMGGPFVSHTRLDEINQRIITVEGFVYAPGSNKRSYIRQMEAILYSLKLPLQLNEVVVTAKKKK